jgi:hypothetical protein
MSINYEYERHIKVARDAGYTGGAEFLRAQMDAFNAARDAGMFEELPLEAGQSGEKPELGQNVLEPAHSLEAVPGGIILSASFDPRDFRNTPTCQNCGREYSTGSKFTRIKSNGDHVQLEIADTRGSYGTGESIFLSRKELEEKGAEIDDPMFPFANPEVFQMVFGDENPDVVYGRLQRYLLTRFVHPWGGEKNCKQYVRQHPPTISSFLLPIFETMQQSGFSLRRIAEAFYPKSVGFHTTIGRRLGTEQRHNQERLVLPVNPRKAKFEWNGIQLSDQGKVISELKIRV